MGYLCVHGHFYQPPRENPWLEAIELQESAHPYHDWNERITAECYAPNAASRILDDDKRITQIVNNYSKISFNFGPTLISWIEAKEPALYRAIREADAESRKTFSGHGSALAQPYNHMIMPLANERDKQTQALWGIRDFEHRFGRYPEGMWLPETAVDVPTLEVLAHLGIKFTILAPSQARRTRKIGGRNWKDMSQGRIDPTMAYRVELPSGRRISVFFYDGPISRAIAFEGLLRNGGQFAQRLLNAFSEDTRPWPELVHIATDGETYGHHHRYGEMALTYALDHIESNKLAVFTNYGEYLERHPPTHVAEIFENSSWSCAHGVERWRSNCGCNSGGHAGWNQEWRAPLRTAFDWLRDTLVSRFEEKAQAFLKDPREARNDYVRVVLDRTPESRQRFLAEHAAKELGEAEKVTVWKLLELQRHAMLMYTSCGWFFDELSGIETVQVIQYAGRAVQLAQEVLGDEVEARFVEKLGLAKSNLAQHQDGARIYLEFVKPAFIDLRKVAVHYAIRSLFEPYEPESQVYRYKVRWEEYLNLSGGDQGAQKLAVGRAQFTSEITQEAGVLDFAALDNGDYNPIGGILKPRAKDAFKSLMQELKDSFSAADLPGTRRHLEENFEGETRALTALFKDEQQQILARIVESEWDEAETAISHLYTHITPIIRTVAKMGTRLPLPRAFSAVAELALNTRLRRALTNEEVDFDGIRNLVTEAEIAKVVLDVPTLEYALRTRLEDLAESFRSQCDDLQRLKHLDAVTSLARSLPFEINLWKMQNIWYELSQTVYGNFQKKAAQGDSDARAWVDGYTALAEKLSLRLGDTADGRNADRAHG